MTQVTFGRREFVVWAAAALFWFDLGCATMAPAAVEAVGTHTAGRPTVVFVASRRWTLFDGLVANFVAMSPGTNVSFLPDIGNDDPAAVVSKVRAMQPALVVTLGGRATELLTKQAPELPILFACVVNAQHTLGGLPNLMGVALETSPVADVSQFRLILPGLKQLVTFYDPDVSGDFVDTARRELSNIGVVLDAVAVKGLEDIEKNYDDHMVGASGVWLINDVMVANPQTFAYLRDRALNEKRPFVTSLSGEYAARGALMSASVDFGSLGAQIAGMAHKFLEGNQSAKEIGIEPPIGGNLVLNMGVAKRIGVEIPADSLPFFTAVPEH